MIINVGYCELNTCTNLLLCRAESVQLYLQNHDNTHYSTHYAGFMYLLPYPPTHRRHTGASCTSQQTPCHCETLSKHPEITVKRNFDMELG